MDPSSADISSEKEVPSSVTTPVADPLLRRVKEIMTEEEMHQIKRRLGAEWSHDFMANMIRFCQGFLLLIANTTRNASLIKTTYKFRHGVRYQVKHTTGQTVILYSGFSIILVQNLDKYPVQFLILIPKTPLERGQKKRASGTFNKFKCAIGLPLFPFFEEEVPLQPITVDLSLLRQKIKLVRSVPSIFKNNLDMTRYLYPLLRPSVLFPRYGFGKNSRPILLQLGHFGAADAGYFNFLDQRAGRYNVVALRFWAILADIQWLLTRHIVLPDLKSENCIFWDPKSLMHTACDFDDASNEDVFHSLDIVGTWTSPRISYVENGADGYYEYKEADMIFAFFVSFVSCLSPNMALRTFSVTVGDPDVPITRDRMKFYHDAYMTRWENSRIESPGPVDHVFQRLWEEAKHVLRPTPIELQEERPSCEGEEESEKKREEAKAIHSPYTLSETSVKDILAKLGVISDIYQKIQDHILETDRISPQFFKNYEDLLSNLNTIYKDETIVFTDSSPVGKAFLLLTLPILHETLGGKLYDVFRKERYDRIRPLLELLEQNVRESVTTRVPEEDFSMMTDDGMVEEAASQASEEEEEKKEGALDESDCPSNSYADMLRYYDGFFNSSVSSVSPTSVIDTHVLDASVEPMRDNAMPSSSSARSSSLFSVIPQPSETDPEKKAGPPSP